MHQRLGRILQVFCHLRCLEAQHNDRHCMDDLVHHGGPLMQHWVGEVKPDLGLLPCSAAVLLPACVCAGAFLPTDDWGGHLRCGREWHHSYFRCNEGMYWQ